MCARGGGRVGGICPLFSLKLLIGPNAVTPTGVSALANIKYVDISRRGCKLKFCKRNYFSLPRGPPVFSIILIIKGEREGVSSRSSSKARHLFSFSLVRTVPSL